MTSSVFPKSSQYWRTMGLLPTITCSIFWITSKLPQSVAFAQDSEATTTVIFDLNADLQDEDYFYDLPYPSDLRLDENNQPDLSGFPVFSSNGFGLFKRLKTIASDRPHFPTTAAGYFRFNQPLAPLHIDDLIPAKLESPILLIDIGRDSPDRGKLFPVVASTPAPDPFYVPNYLLAISPYPGIVLHPKRQYAYVVLDSLKDANNNPLQTTDTFVQLRQGDVPQGQMRRKFRAYTLYQPLWETLDQLGINRDTVVAATVFTTGDVVADMAELSKEVSQAYTPDIKALEHDPNHVISDVDYCKFTAQIKLPQFQKGFPPYFEYGEREGLFVLDDHNNLEPQRYQTVPVVLTLPKTPMPPAGYPLVAYYHGTGGLSTQVVDRGPVPQPDLNRLLNRLRDRGFLPALKRLPDRGPADVVARHGFAAVSSALPLNPERLDNIAAMVFSELLGGRIYLNPVNLSAYRDTFRQGIFEQRILLSALERLKISPDVLADCEGPTLPEGETHFRLQTESVMALGQSQGAQYALMMAAIEPKIKAVVPTGSGGFWALLFSSLANPREEYDLNLMTLESVDDLPSEGDNLVFVAKIGDGYHVRIFDINGDIVLDKGNHELLFDEDLTQKINTALKFLNDEAELDTVTKRSLVQEITSSLDHDSEKHWEKALKQSLPDYCQALLNMDIPEENLPSDCSVDDLIPEIGNLLGQIHQRSEPLNHLYPALRLLQSSWEWVEPMVYAPRIAKRPLEGHPVRSIYQPVGQSDSDFPEEIFNAMALASGVQQADSELWPEMQASLALEGLEGIIEEYPITYNLTSETGVPYTGIVVQYEGDGIKNSHTIFSQRLDVKYQYGCFLESISQFGTPTVLSPEPILPPCRFP